MLGRFVAKQILSKGLPAAATSIIPCRRCLATTTTATTTTAISSTSQQGEQQQQEKTLLRLQTSLQGLTINNKNKFNTVMTMTRASMLPWASSSHSGKHCQHRWMSTTTAPAVPTDTPVVVQPKTVPTDVALVLPTYGQNPLDAFRDSVPRAKRMDDIVGRSWSVTELRRKGFYDLWRLWVVLYKERNMLYTEKQISRRKLLKFPQPNRIQKVKKSMGAIRAVLGERQREREKKKLTKSSSSSSNSSTSRKADHKDEEEPSAVEMEEALKQMDQDLKRPV